MDRRKKNMCTNTNVRGRQWFTFQTIYWLCENFKHFKSWRYFPHFQCALDTTVANQSDELAMNWTSDNDVTIHSPKYRGEYAKICFNMFTTAPYVHVYVVACSRSNTYRTNLCWKLHFFFIRSNKCTRDSICDKVCIFNVSLFAAVCTF